MRTHRLAWLPPFMVGAAAAVAGEVAGGLLLYSGAGFLRALTLVLATVMGAFALGLWSAPDPGVEHPVEALRRRWLVALVAFALAAAAAAGWSVLGGLASSGLTRGIGLALLAAVPLYGAGALLGTMAAVRADVGVRGPGSAAAAGAAAGAVFTGTLFIGAERPLPSSAHVLVLVALSASALLHGRVLDRWLSEPEEPVTSDEPPGVAAPPASDEPLATAHRPGDAELPAGPTGDDEPVP